MKKGLIFALIIFATLMAIIQPTFAWAASNHYEIAEEVYYSLPNDVQVKLDLSEMINGADDPDYKFFDFQNHHYPASQEKANEWLEKGHNYYINEDYQQASYCFGVATHYISDGICPPHSGGGHSGYQHTKYEVQAMFLQPQMATNGHNIISLAEYCQISENSWVSWIKTGDTKYIQQCLDYSADLSYVAVKNATS
jgi:hypothetical protein